MPRTRADLSGEWWWRWQQDSYLWNWECTATFIWRWHLFCEWDILSLPVINLLSGFHHPHYETQPGMIYALLPKKQRHSYNHAYMLLKDATFDLGLTLDPLSLMCDFELAIIRVSPLNFPNASHRGCYYHYMQSIWCKVQSLGLANVYRSNDPTVKQFVQKMAAIAFCPPSLVRLDERLERGSEGFRLVSGIQWWNN